MRLRGECLAMGLGLCLAGGHPGNAGAASSNAPASPAPANAAPIGTYLTRDEIRAAATKLRADPNLGGEKTLRTLRWNEVHRSSPRRPVG